MKKKMVGALLPLLVLAMGCTPEESTQDLGRDCLYQVSTLQALTAGYYYGVTPVKDFMTHGDIGLGTFEGVEGEMIVLDGVCYQALSDGRVVVANESVTVPFAAITWFEADVRRELKAEYTFETLKKELDKMVGEEGANAFYAMSLTGTFPEMKVRSVVKQQVPYIPLNEALKTDQTVFDYTDVKGTLIALYCPPYVSGVNAVGWHMHFLNDAKDKGGHVLDLRLSEGVVELDRTDDFFMMLPDTDSFNSLDLTGLDDAVSEVEQ